MNPRPTRALASSGVFVAGMIVAACGGPRLSLRPGTQATEAKARDDFECKAASTERRYFCTKDKTLLGQEVSLLGTVYKVDKVGGACPVPFSADERKEPIVPAIDKQALNVTNSVVTQVDFALVKRTVAANVSALAFLESSLDGEAVASVELLRSTRSVIEDDKFNAAVTAVALRHPGACRLYVATGYAADYFTARVYTSARAKAGGGVYGLNVGGTYFASDETVKRDYQWAISIVKIDIGDSPNKDAEPKLTFEAPVTKPEDALIPAFGPVGGLI